MKVDDIAKLNIKTCANCGSRVRDRKLSLCQKCKDEMKNGKAI